VTSTRPSRGLKFCARITVWTTVREGKDSVDRYARGVMRPSERRRTLKPLLIDLGAEVVSHVTLCVCTYHQH
jgi:hypothetical protein